MPSQAVCTRKALRIRSAPAPMPEAAVLERRLAIVASLRHRLPVVAIPKERHVAAMRDDVIKHGGGRHAQCAGHAIGTCAKRVRPQDCFAYRLPSPSITARTGTLAPLVLLALPFCAMRRASARIGQHAASWLAAGTLCCCWHKVKAGKFRASETASIDSHALRCAGVVILIVGRDELKRLHGTDYLGDIVPTLSCA